MRLITAEGQPGEVYYIPPQTIIGSMTGAISGAALGQKAIPKRWLDRITEPVYTPEKVRAIGFDLCRKGEPHNFRAG
jgi:hypothetical protein